MAYTGKTNWQNNEIVEAADMNRIEQGVTDNDTGLTVHKNNTSNPHQTTKSQVELGNVDNTSDVNKPVSTAQQAALDLKANKDLSNVSDVDFLTKAQASGIVTDIIPENKTRYKVVVTSFDGGAISNRAIRLTNGSETVIAYTKVNGEAIIEVDYGIWTLSLTDVPTGYKTPISQEIDGVAGTQTTVNFFLDEKTVIKYGVRIQLNNSNPETSVEYINDSAGFTPSVTSGSSFVDNGWASRWPFNAIKPCLFKDGVVVGYLNPNNYAQFEDGSAADITSGAAGDVMVEFPKMYLKISRDASYQYVEIADEPETGFTDYPFSYKGVVKDKFYIGAYKGFNSSGKLRSLSGKTPTASQTRATFRGYAQANGVGYEIVPYNKLILMQALYLIRFKHLNSQIALGRGNVDASALKTTGATNTLGMCYGKNDTTNQQVKCNGIEDFWGNIWEWIDGLHTVGTTIYTQDGNFTDNATGAISRGTFAANFAGYISDIWGTDELGFFIKEGGSSGSETTYYCDCGQCASGCVASFGGYWYYASYAGAFHLNVNDSPSLSLSQIGARVTFCG